MLIHSSKDCLHTDMSVPKPPPGHFNLLYFASASSFTRKDSEALPAPLPVSELYDALEKRYPGIKAKVLSSCALTVNLEYVDLEDNEAAEAEQIIKEGDEVAIIPPVSSG